MEPKFKGGDRVKIVSLGLYYPEVQQGLFEGNLATVRGYSEDDALVLVATDGDTWSPVRGVPSCWSFEEKELEKLGGTYA